MPVIVVDRRTVSEPLILLIRIADIDLCDRGCTLVAQTLAEILMFMRVWALYSFSKRGMFDLRV
jgi:hypothetical protein